MRLQTNSKYKSPPRCRNASPTRNCWACVNDAHALIVSMRNAPRRLALAGREDDDNGAWFRAYARWAQALQAQEREATDATAKTLAQGALFVAQLDRRSGVLVEHRRMDHRTLTASIPLRQDFSCGALAALELLRSPRMVSEREGRAVADRPPRRFRQAPRTASLPELRSERCAATRAYIHSELFVRVPNAFTQ